MKRGKTESYNMNETTNEYMASEFRFGSVDFARYFVVVKTARLLATLAQLDFTYQ